MIPDLAFHRPATIGEACALSRTLGPAAAFLAGGTELLPDFHRGRESARHLIALNRIAENQLIVEWVRRSLNERAAGYRFALERLVISYPSPMAVDTERSLNHLRRQVGENQRVAIGK